MILCEDIHNLILSKIFSYEDHVNYCEVFNIPLRLDLCKELHLSFKSLYKGINTKYINNLDNTYIEIIICEESVRVKNVHKDDLPYIVDEFIDDCDELCNIFANKCIIVDYLDTLRFIKDYIRLGNDIYICYTKDDKDLSDEICSILENINVRGIIKTENYNYPDNIGLFKIKFYHISGRHQKQIIRKYMLIDSRYIYMLYDSDIIEILEILWLERTNTITIKNMPNLKYLKITILGKKEFEEFIINIENMPKLKIIITNNMDPKYISADMIKKMNIIKHTKL